MRKSSKEFILTLHLKYMITHGCPDRLKLTFYLTNFKEKILLLFKQFWKYHFCKSKRYAKHVNQT